jgi:hypothetical protein
MIGNLIICGFHEPTTISVLELYSSDSEYNSLALKFPHLCGINHLSGPNKIVLKKTEAEIF